MRTVQLQRAKKVLFFVDGPCHNEEADTLVGSMHYLCTSGGHPYPASESMLSKLLLVMSAWDKDTYRQGLKQFKNEAAMEIIRNYYMYGGEESENENMEIESIEEMKEDEALTDDVIFDFVFYYTGGRMREAVQIVSGCHNIQRFVKVLRARISSVDIKDAKLALTSSMCSASKKSIDSFRSMFRLPNDAAFQIIDSQLIIGLLQDRVATEEYLNSFKQALAQNQRAIAGYHFEALMHSVFCNTTHNGDDPVQGALKATGNGREGVKQLIEQSIYWIPSISNFANIDAASVDKRLAPFLASSIRFKRSMLSTRIHSARSF